MNKNELKKAPLGKNASLIIDVAQKLKLSEISFVDLTVKDIHRFARHHKVELSKEDVRFLKLNYQYTPYEELIDGFLESVMEYRNSYREGFPISETECAVLVKALRSKLRNQEDMRKFIATEGN